MSNTKDIQKHYFKAVKLAEKHVEVLAREVLNKNPELDEFIMGMGCVFFTEKEYTNESIYLNKVKEAKRLDSFIAKWDEYLKLTGSPMRFTAKGKKITSW